MVTVTDYCVVGRTFSALDRPSTLPLEGASEQGFEKLSIDTDSVF